jgi:hypothetical protein
MLKIGPDARRPEGRMIMREELLQFIWQYRHFNQQGLVTEDGRPLVIEYPGEKNTDQGPDCRSARVCIGNLRYEGPVELHIRASDWLRHGHQNDPRYQPVILHVVWENDQPGAAGNIPVLALATRVSKLLLGRYEHWMRQVAFIPCERQLPAIDAIIRHNTIQTLSIQRLQHRSTLVRTRLEQCRGDWEETTWWMLARSMGLPVNAAVFEAVAKSLPLRLLRRHRNYAATLKTLVLGQAGLVKDEGDMREYRFWQTKYRLRQVQEPLSFLRMRPGNLPARRLAQLAELSGTGKSWFSLIRDSEDWHAVLADLTQISGLGAQMRQNIVINTFVPLLYAYGQPEKAIRWLIQLPAENNHLIRGWATLGMIPANAAQSQGLLELKKEYCDARRCMDCAIGRACLTN